MMDRRKDMKNTGNTIRGEKEMEQRTRQEKPTRNQ